MLEFDTPGTDGPARVGMHSAEGFGKTFLASFFPNTMWIAPENGFPRDLPIRPRVIKGVREWTDVLKKTDEVGRMDLEADATLVYDTMDWIEPMIWEYCMERDTGRQTELNRGGNKLISIEDYGFSKGYVAAEEEMRRLIKVVDDAQGRQFDRGRRLHVVMLMHSAIGKFDNPAGANYNRYEPKMHKLAAAVCKQWVENLLFGYYEVFAAKSDPKEKKAKGVSTGKRLLGTRNNAAYDAKNRVQLPDVVELTDPGIIVPYLLGQVAVESPYKIVGRADPATQKKASRVDTEQKAESEVGKPAHHPDRVDDERQRAADAMAKAASRDDGPKSVDPAKTEARTFTEPKPFPPLTTDGKAEKTEKPKTKQPVTAKNDPLTPDEERMAKLASVLALAQQELGDAYRAKVDKWVKLAAGDADKIDSIIDDVEQTIAAKAA